MAFNDELKKIRTDMNLKQREFAAKYCISGRSYEGWEIGKSAPPEYLGRLLGYAMALEARLGVDVVNEIREELGMEKIERVCESKAEAKQKKRVTAYKELFEAAGLMKKNK